jgi:hypothetical protein
MREHLTITNFNEIRGALTTFPDDGRLVFKIYTEECLATCYLLASDYSKLCQALLVDKKDHPKGVQLNIDSWLADLPEPGNLVALD